MRGLLLSSLQTVPIRRNGSDVNVMEVDGALKEACQFPEAHNRDEPFITENFSCKLYGLHKAMQTDTGTC